MMNCLFCSIVDAPTFERPEDEIIDETEHFYAKAALGHFIHGYTLVVSKDHFISYADLPVGLFPELDEFSSSVCHKITAITCKSVMIFEHGAIDRPHRAGSCIDHAHLHLFPTSDLLVAPLTSRFSFVQLATHSDVTRFRTEGTPYLYFRVEPGTHYAAAVAGGLPNQFIRRLACDHLGFPELWDWRDTPLRDRLEAFKERYKRLR